MNQQKPMRMWPWFLLLALLTPLAGFATYKALQTNEAWLNEREAFRAHLEEYAAPPKTTEPSPNAISVGKVVVVNLADHALDPLQFEMPDDLRATRPEEVVSVVQTRITKRQVGKYEDGGKAFQEDYEVAVIHLASGALLGSATLTGPEPASLVHRVNSNQEVSGGPPKAALIEFLRSLP